MEEFTRASEFLDAGRSDLAESLVRRGLERDPDNAFGHAILSLACTLSKRLPEAEAEALEAIRLAPGNPFGHYVLGCALQDAGRVIEASGAATRALELDPVNWTHVHLMGRVRFAQRRLEECRDLVAKGLERDPSNAWLMSLHIDVLRAQGRDGAADVEAKRPAASRPEWSQTQFHLGWAALRKGDEDAARGHFLDALRMDPWYEPGKKAVALTGRRIPCVVGVLAAGAAVVSACVFGILAPVAAVKPVIWIALGATLAQVGCLVFVRELSWRRRTAAAAWMAGMSAGLCGLCFLDLRRGHVTDAKFLLGCWAVYALILCVVPFARRNLR